MTCQTTMEKGKSKHGVKVVIPVYNEEHDLEPAVRRLWSYFSEEMPHQWEIVIANNASTDGTKEIADKFAGELTQVRAIHLDAKGRGRALREAWTTSSADILAYMDVDLSTDLSTFPAMIQALAGGSYDLATASRLLRPASTERSWQREILSRVYNWLIRRTFGIHFSDAQCGFKALTRQAAEDLLPRIENNEWFFDTELLVWAEKLGYRIFDFPAAWKEDPDSRVNIIPTIMEDLRGIVRLRKALRASKLNRSQPHAKMLQ